MDSELARRKPGERPHGEVVGAAIVDSKLFCDFLKKLVKWYARRGIRVELRITRNKLSGRRV